MPKLPEYIHSTNMNSGMSSQDPMSNSDYSASDYNQTASFVYSAEYTAPVLSALKPSVGERIVDFGCGTGELTLQIQEAVGATGLTVGIDYNNDMVSKALTNGVKHAFVSDLQDLRIPAHLFEENSFDAVFSNAALHWCKEHPRGVLNGAKRLLKDGGRFVCEMGGFMNCTGVRFGLHRAVKKRGYEPDKMDPWYFPSIAEYQGLLQSAGFRVNAISLVPRLTPLRNGGLHGWLQLFARRTFLKEFSDEEAAAIIDEVIDMCEVDMKDKEGNWAIMYVRLRFLATLDSP
ncbi:S-adenosyl-L-methionine-dependent methyltransferase [Suillus paluster]|uniref:S-adenosyl-L-methionine-dependent methyltransferase n=1 Tax=Suillus paluster TaxID=48578 RepID=UPI001B86EE1B|nr:S-adenosyl-L-methionine-dependent methyltransferase [Suillus paluster]KAG1743242.1 S-adenosyl-L-methionine-dependent methyltransferase [Suillus paluster]